MSTCQWWEVSPSEIWFSILLRVSATNSGMAMFVKWFRQGSLHLGLKVWSIWRNPTLWTVEIGNIKFLSCPKLLQGMAVCHCCHLSSFSSSAGLHDTMFIRMLIAQVSTNYLYYYPSLKLLFRKDGTWDCHKVVHFHQVWTQSIFI